MLQPQRRITFTRKDGYVIVYDYVTDITIEKNNYNLTNTAKIVIPRKLVYKSGKPLSPTNKSLQDNITIPAPNDTENVAYVVGADALFSRGDQVTIEIGYYPNLQTRFKGYIDSVTTTMPIEITCQDKMWLLKQHRVTYPDPTTYTYVGKSKTSIRTPPITLKQLLDGIFQYFPYRINYVTIDDNLNLGSFRISNVTPAKVLEVLKDRYGLYSSFDDDGVLHVGWFNDATNTNTQEFVMEEVVINNDTLNYVNENDIKVRIHGVSMNADNTKLEYDFPEDETDGDTITKFTYNQDMDGLKKFVQNLLPTVRYTGYRGKIRTFGEPMMNPGDIAKITSYKLPERNGFYLVKGVTTEDGTKGFFQEIELGKKIQ